MLLSGDEESPQIERTWTDGVTVSDEALDKAAVTQALASPQDQGVLGDPTCATSGAGPSRA